MRSQHKRAFRFHPRFKECKECLRLVPIDHYGWHKDGWQVRTCPSCRYTRDKKSRKFKTDRRYLTPDEKTIILLGHAQGWAYSKIAARVNRTPAAVKTWIHYYAAQQNRLVYLAAEARASYGTGAPSLSLEQQASPVAGTRPALG